MTEQITNVTNGEATRLISGSVIWLHDLTFQATPLEYQILNRRYQTGIENEITIPANAEANPRFAVIWADVFGNVGYTLGAAAPAPAIPHVNDSTQIELCPIYIPANSGTPGTDPDGGSEEPTDIVIYDEGTEWTPGKTEEAGIAIDLLATDSPKNGTKNVKLTVTPAAGTGFENLGLVSVMQNGSTARQLGVFGGGLNFGLSLEFLGNNKTDQTTGDTRTLIWYKARKQDISGYAESVATGEKIPFSCYEVQQTAFDKADLGFTTQAASGLVLKSAQVLNGNYIIHIDYAVTKYVQQYKITQTANITPAAAEFHFTAAAPVNIKGGLISIWGKFSALLANSGFLVNLYKGVDKMGNVFVLPGTYGLSASSAEYQEISVPVADFGLSSFDVDKLEIKPVNTWAASVSDFDLIKIQKGVTPEPATDIYTDSATLDGTGKLILTRTGGKLPLEVQFSKAAKTGNYQDLENKPTIPSGQIQSDWSQANNAQPDYIKNKPTIPAGQVQSDWNQITNTQPDYIKNKPTLGTIASKNYWTGTAAAYAAVTPKDANTIYFVEE